MRLFWKRYQKGRIRLFGARVCKRPDPPSPKVKVIFPIDFMDMGAFPRLSWRHGFPFFRALFLCLALVPSTFAEGSQSRALLDKEINHPDGSVKEKYRYYLEAGNREVRDGLQEEFYPDGSKKGEITWREGKENGLVTYFHPDGRKSYQANYVDGKKNGYATVWHPNGQKQWQTVFRNGLAHGVWREWHADGKKKFEANYNNGKLEGLATWWHENGRIWQERSYQSGGLRAGSVREWDKTGRQIYPPRDSRP